MNAPIVGRPPINPDDLQYDHHVAFYERFLSHLFARDPDIEPGWCPEWRQHYAADWTVSALWRAYEQLNLDPGAGQASWLVNLAQPAMTALMADPGPFSGCSTSRHTPVVQPLP